MKKGILLFLTGFVASFFILNNVSADNTDIIINEIGAYEPSGFEWVEIYNKGQAEVDLSGWKFWEAGTNHGLSVTGTADFILGAGEYGAIVQDVNKFLSKYPNFSGTVFDSSWSGLNESGEEIGLKDNGGNLIETFIYSSAPDFSLERKDYALADYTINNWNEHSSGNTVGAVNSNYGIIVPIVPPVEPIVNEPIVTEPIVTEPIVTEPVIIEPIVEPIVSVPETPVLSPVIIPLAPTENLYIWQKIKINEFSSYPVGVNEWVELYNTGDLSQDLANGLLCDNRNTTSSCKILSGTIDSKNWLVLDLGTNRFLNNDGDSLILKTPSGVIIDKVDYGDSGIDVPSSGLSAMRKTDGAGGNNFSDWIVDIPTPGTANQYQNKTPTAVTPSPISEIIVNNPSTVSTTVPKISTANVIVPFASTQFSAIISSAESANKTATKTTVTTKTSAVKNIITPGEIAKVRDLAKGKWVKIKGLVAVLPAVFGTQYFYIIDQANGIQIYQSKKDFPELNVGDEVEITGYMSEAQGIKKINVKNKEAIDILSIGNEVEAVPMSVEDLSEENLGLLVQVEGDITEIKSNYLYLDNDTAEIVVYFKTGAKINKENFKEGDKARIIGILEKTTNGLQVWPRSNDDLEIIVLEKNILENNSVNETANNGYVKTTVGGLMAMMVGFWARARSALFLGGAKRVAGLITKFITKV